jgi:hypothetical protein
MHFTCYWWVPYNNATETKTSSFFDEYSAPYALIIHRSFLATRCRCTTGGWHVKVQLADRLHVFISQLSKRRMLSVSANKVRYRVGGEEADARLELQYVCISSMDEQIRNHQHFFPTSQMSNEHESLLYEGVVAVRQGLVSRQLMQFSTVGLVCHQRGGMYCIIKI